MTLALVSDAVIGNVQEYVLKQYKAPTNEVMAWAYSFGTLYVFIYITVIENTLLPAIKLSLQVNKLSVDFF